MTMNSGGHDDDFLNLKYAILTKFLVFAEGMTPEGTALGAGTSADAEINAAAEISGIVQDANDEVYFAINPDDFDFDPSADIQASVIGCSSSADADTGFKWAVALKKLAVGDADSTDAKVSPNGSGTSAGSATGGAKWFATEWFSLGVTADAFKSISQGGTCLLVLGAVTCASIGTASADEVRVFAVQLRAARKITNPNGRQMT